MKDGNLKVFPFKPAKILHWFKKIRKNEEEFGT